MRNRIDRSTIVRVLALVLISLTSGCGEPGTGHGGGGIPVICSNNAQPVLAVVASDPADLYIPVGAVGKFKVMGRCPDWEPSYYFYLNGSDTVKWMSKNRSIASVDSAGLFETEFSTGFSPGSTEISATWMGLQGNTALTVTSETLQALNYLAAEDSTVWKGYSVRLFVYGKYSDNSTHRISPTSFTWKSSDESIARIAASGLALGISPGNCLITATSGTITLPTTLTVRTLGTSYSPLVKGKLISSKFQ